MCKNPATEQYRIGDALLQQIETDYFDHILSTILPGVIEDPERHAQAATPILGGIKEQVVTMRWSLIEAQALAQGAFRALTPSTPGGPQLH